GYHHSAHSAPPHGRHGDHHTPGRPGPRPRRPGRRSRRCSGRDRLRADDAGHDAADDRHDRLAGGRAWPGLAGAPRHQRPHWRRLRRHAGAPGVRLGHRARARPGVRLRLVDPRPAALHAHHDGHGPAVRHGPLRRHAHEPGRPPRLRGHYRHRLQGHRRTLL
ncbi:MAG: hypothetical protein AVDCRST_MAG77-3458, partial [uncultured Chloroflexi bacterium]